MTTLKPCPNPWCVRNEVRFRLSDAGYRLRCRCGIRGPLAETAVSAESAWNHRPGEAAVAEECARIAERAMDGIVGAEIAMNIRSRFGGKA